MAEQSACSEGRLLRVSSLFVARCQRGNPAMTDNVTARLCLRGSPHKEGDGRKARKENAVIERRGEMLGEEGGKARELPEERVTAATDAIPPPPPPSSLLLHLSLPRDESMTK